MSEDKYTIMCSEKGYTPEFDKEVNPDMFKEKCNCGKPIRYVIRRNEDNEMIGSCNKYCICPTYDELRNDLGATRVYAKKLERKLEVLREGFKILTEE